MSEDAIKLDWHAVSSSSADAVERVARALCRHEKRNPDLPIPSDTREPVFAEDGIAELKPVPVPLWTEYAEEASRFIAAFRAYSETTDRS